MKKILISVICIMVVVVSVFSFTACSKALTQDETYALISKAVDFSTNKLADNEQYYVRHLKYDAARKTVVDERFINVWPDDKSTSDIDEFRSHYYKVDSSDLKETKYFNKFFGASLPTTEKKTKNPTADKYKIYLYDEVVTDGKPTGEYVKTAMTKAEYLAQDYIKDITATYAIDLIRNISAENTEFLSATQTGHITEIVLKLKQDIRTAEQVAANYINLYEYQKESDGLMIRVLDNKVDAVAIVGVNKNKVDDNVNVAVAYYVTYVGPNLKYFGVGNRMPNWDEIKDAA